MSRLPKLLVTAAALVVIAAGLYSLSPYVVEYGIENGCSLARPDAACTKRMRWMGDAWSFKGNRARAQLWYERAAAAGDVPSMFQLGWIYEQQVLDHIKTLNDEWQQLRRSMPSPALSAPSPSGITRIDPAVAERLMTGRPAAPGGSRSPEEAHLLAGIAQLAALCAQSADWYRRAADQGFGPAMNNLGVLYSTGLAGSLGAPDKSEALRWYRAAAAAGNPVGLWNVGTAYANGLGVARDPSEAARWATWHPSPRIDTTAAELGDAVLSRTTLFSGQLSDAQRAGLRAAARAGTPFSIILPTVDEAVRRRLG